jgi:predicted nuclease of predicted toxin-antitoxin system
MDRLFIDECLNATLVAIAKERGIPADYGPHIGMAGWQDWNIAQFAFENGYIIVTNNRRHFLREFLKHEVHNGLVVIVPNVERKQQMDLFARLLDYLAGVNDLPINKLIEILEDGSIYIREWTSNDHDIGHINSPTWTNPER